MLGKFRARTEEKSKHRGYIKGKTQGGWVEVQRADAAVCEQCDNCSLSLSRQGCELPHKEGFVGCRAKLTGTIAEPPQYLVLLSDSEQELRCRA